MKRLFLHPVLNLQPRNAVEVVDVTCNDDKVFFKGCSSNEHIHVANSLAVLFQKMTNLTVFLEIANIIAFKGSGYICNLIKMLLPARFICSKIQFCKRNIRYFTVMHPNVSQMFDKKLFATMDKEQIKKYIADNY